VTLKLAEKSVVKSRPSVPYGGNFLVWIWSEGDFCNSWVVLQHRCQPQM